MNERILLVEDDEGIAEGRISATKEISEIMDSTREESVLSSYFYYGFDCKNRGEKLDAVKERVLFLAAAVIILYYKQLSEGYEDVGRYNILQKVGMTKKEIRQSINSQMLSVFFLPLLVAVVHLCFAFPMIQKLLLLFSLTNIPLLMLITGVSIAVFALVYAIVYRITSNTYFKIVSGGEKE